MNTDNDCSCNQTLVQFKAVFVRSLFYPQIEAIIATVRDSNLKLTLAFGIGMHHAGLHERDRKTVEELFVNCKIQVSSQPHTNMHVGTTCHHCLL